MLERRDVMPINYYKKEAFTGSMQGMRFMLRKKETEEGDRLEAIIWPQPLCFEKTDEEKKIHAVFAFDEGGIMDALEWMNGQYAKKQDLFLSAAALTGMEKN